MRLSHPMSFPRSGRIACQGIEGSNSQLACDKLFQRGNIMFFKSFAGVFDAVQSGLCDYGVLPVENSVNGSVRAVYDLLRSKKCYIVRGTTLHIRHDLLGLPGAELSDITEIYSHEQALGQCSKFIATLGGKVKDQSPAKNTGRCSKKKVADSRPAHRGQSSAACASIRLNALALQIHSDNNYTRLCASRKSLIYAVRAESALCSGLTAGPARFRKCC